MYLEKINFEVMANLANTTAQAKAAQLGVTGLGNLDKFIQAEAQEREDAVMKEAAVDIVSIIGDIDRYKTELATNIVQYETLISAQLALNDQITKAKEYGLSTLNFWPAMLQMGASKSRCPVDKDKIPKDWKPATVDVPVTEVQQ